MCLIENITMKAAVFCDSCAKTDMIECYYLPIAADKFFAKGWRTSADPQKVYCPACAKKNPGQLTGSRESHPIAGNEFTTLPYILSHHNE